MNIIKNIIPAPDLIIMEFPQEIYRFEAYLEFIKYSRGEYKGVRLLFFIDKTSPLILAFIAAAQPDAVLHKREALQVVRETCATLARQETSERHVVNRQRAAAITPGEAAVLCETARTEDIRLTRGGLTCTRKPFIRTSITPAKVRHPQSGRTAEDDCAVVACR